VTRSDRPHVPFCYFLNLDIYFKQHVCPWHTIARVLPPPTLQVTASTRATRALIIPLQNPGHDTHTMSFNSSGHQSGSSSAIPQLHKGKESPKSARSKLGSLSEYKSAAYVASKPIKSLGNYKRDPAMQSEASSSASGSGQNESVPLLGEHVVPRKKLFYRARPLWCVVC
jgi:hypothetical protein